MTSKTLIVILESMVDEDERQPLPDPVSGTGETQSSWRRLVHWLQQPWWQGTSGVLAVLGLVVAAGGLVVAVKQLNEASGDEGAQSVAPQTRPIAESGNPPDRGCEADAAAGDVLDSALFVEENANRVNPRLDFGEMNGSAWYAKREGRFYYWGRAGNDTPTSGGARLRWRTDALPWHGCAVALPANEQGYVRTPAVATEMNGRPVTAQVCLWRDDPHFEQCTVALRTPPG